jgi:hypothetical protein
MSSPIAPKDINTNNFKYTEVKVLASGAKAVYINYGSGKLRIQTPVMFLPYGVSEGFEDKKADKKIENKVKKYNLTLSFKGQDENPKIEIFLNKMKEIENKIISDAFENREPWFKDDFDGNKAIVSRLFSPIIKIDKDKNTGKIIGKYPPTINFKLPYDMTNDKFNFQSFNMDDNELIDFGEIAGKLKSGKAQLIVELNSIWFAGGKFGCTWKINAGKFKCSVNNSFSFIEDSDTEKVKNDEDEDDEEIDDVSSKLDDTKINNSDDECIGEEESAPVPVAEKKKGGRGSKK